MKYEGIIKRIYGVLNDLAIEANKFKESAFSRKVKYDVAEIGKLLKDAEYQLGQEMKAILEKCEVDIRNHLMMEAELAAKRRKARVWWRRLLRLITFWKPLAKQE